jgi:ligand-binding sensor domain-containing protein/signal transduction histidine kinase
VEEGLPEDSVQAVRQCRDGYLWCLTSRRLCRFDGFKFTLLDWAPAGANPEWLGVHETQEGRLWVHGGAGAFPYAGRPGREAWWGSGALPSNTVIRAIVEDAQRTLWAATALGLCRYDGDLRRIFRVPGDPVPGGMTALDADAKGDLWVAAGSNLYRFGYGHFTRQVLPPLKGDAGLAHVSVAPDGVVWASTAGALLCRVNAQWRVVDGPFQEWHPRWRITALRALEAGELWLGTTTGLWRFKDNRWAVLAQRDGYYPLEVRDVTRDAEGNVWVATSGGLLRLRPKALQHFGAGLALEQDAFTAVLPEARGELLVGVAGAGLLAGKPGAFRPVARAPLARSAVVSALFRDREGTLWIGTQGDYLWKFRDGAATCVLEVPGASRSAVNVNAILEDRQGRLWVGTGDGLMRLDARREGLEPVPDLPVEGRRVHALLEARNGDLWVALQGSGLLQIQAPQAVVVHERSQGLPSDTVLALCEDAEGNLWAGTGEGLGCWDGRGWRRLGEAQGLPDGAISQILEDGKTLWLGSRRGLARFAKADLAEALAGVRGVVTAQVFGRNEGLPEEQCASGFGHLAARSREGLLWFCTVNGLVMADPRRIPERRAWGLRVYLEEIRSNQGVLARPVEERAQGPVTLALPAGTDRLVIRYSAPFFSNPEQVQFKTMLEGHEATWSPPTCSRSAVYSRLSPGAYRFRIMAGVGGGWRESSAGLDFVLAPYPWQTPWFMLAAGGAILAMVGVGVRLAGNRRYRRQVLALEREQALLRERTRIAQDLHDDLGAALTEVGLLSAVARRPAVGPERAKGYLGDIAVKVRAMVDKLDEIVWAVNPRNDSVISLANYFCEYAQRLLQHTPIACRLEIDGSLPDCPLAPEQRHHLFLAFSEALNNVIRHAGASEVRVGVVREGGGVVVTVEDNGRGLSGKPLAEGSDGLAGMRRRLAAMGGRCEVFSGPGKGVVVRLVMPLSGGPHDQGRGSRG